MSLHSGAYFPRRMSVSDRKDTACPPIYLPLHHSMHSAGISAMFQSLQPTWTGNHDEAHLGRSANTNWEGKCNYIKKCSIPSESAPVEWIQALLLHFGNCTETFQSIIASLFEYVIFLVVCCSRGPLLALGNQAKTHKQPAGCVSQI